MQDGQALPGEDAMGDGAETAAEGKAGEKAVGAANDLPAAEASQRACCDCKHLS